MAAFLAFMLAGILYGLAAWGVTWLALAAVDRAQAWQDRLLGEEGDEDDV